MPGAVAVDFGTRFFRLAYLPGGRPPPQVLDKLHLLWQEAGFSADPGPKLNLKVDLPQAETSRAFTSLRAEAGRLIGEEITGVVVSHPPYEGNHYRERLREILRLAGFKYARLVSEPAAAALYLLSRLSEGSVVLIYSLGAGDLTLSLYKVDGGNIVELGKTRRWAELSGQKLTQLLVDRLKSRFEEMNGPQQSDSSQALYWWNEAERIKVELSKSAEVIVLPPQSQTSEIVFTRKEFDTLVKPLLLQSMDICQRIVEENKIKLEELADVWLMGGCKDIQTLGTLISDWFGRDPQWVDDYTVALGAALQIPQIDWNAPLQPTTVLKSEPSSPARQIENRLKQAYPQPQVAAPIGTTGELPIQTLWRQAENLLEKDETEGALQKVVESEDLLKQFRAKIFHRQGQLLEESANQPQTEGKSPEQYLSDALVSFRNAAHLNPKEPTYQESYSRVQRRLEQQKAYYLYQQGQKCENQKNWNAAKDNYIQAVSKDPSNSTYRHAYIRMLYYIAKDLYDRAEKTQKDSQRKDRFSAALDYLNKAREFLMEALKYAEESELRRLYNTVNQSIDRIARENNILYKKGKK